MGLALVVIEEHAGRAMHLRNDDALGAVDDEGAVVGHERNVAHVDILLLDVLDRLGAGLFVDIEHDQAQRHLERRGVGHAALAALVDVVFRRLEFVFDEFEHRGRGEVRNREHRLEHRLQALVGPAALRLHHQQELVVGRLLNLNEVRHLRDFLDFSEKLPNALPTDKRLRHYVLSLNRTIGLEPPDFDRRSNDPRTARVRRRPGIRGDQGDSPEGRNPSRPSGQASNALCLTIRPVAPNRLRRQLSVITVIRANHAESPLPPPNRRQYLTYRESGPVRSDPGTSA